MVWHPLNLLSPDAQWWLFIALLLPSVMWLLWQAGLGRALRSGEAPFGIRSLEMATSNVRSCQIIDSWGDELRQRARQQASAHYLFIPVYTTMLALLAIWAARSFASQGADNMARFALRLAWVPWIAGLFDFAGKSGLLRTLSIYPDVPARLSRFTGWTARFKLAMLLTALSCCLLLLLTPRP